MAQVQEVKLLSKTQIQNTLKNLCNCLEIPYPLKKLSEGKPVFSAETIQKYKLPKITKFAENYTLYEGTSKKNNENLDMFFIVIETNKFDKQNLMACIYYWHMIESKVKSIQPPTIKPTADDPEAFETVVPLSRPQVYICPAFVVTETMLKQHIPINLLPCLYRFAPLTEMYPLIGSANGIGGFTYDYDRTPYKPLYNKREYPIVFDSDPIVKILNAMPGELIQCKRIIFEASPYVETHIRVVQEIKNTINNIKPSGICYGTSNILASEPIDEEQ